MLLHFELTARSLNIYAIALIQFSLPSLASRPACVCLELLNLEISRIFWQRLDRRKQHSARSLSEFQVMSQSTEDDNQLGHFNNCPVRKFKLAYWISSTDCTKSAVLAENKLLSLCSDVDQFNKHRDSRFVNLLDTLPRNVQRCPGSWREARER